MSETNQRIEHFRKMAADDPENELAHFSLGRACLEAGLDDGAIASFQRVLALKPEMSMAYKLLGEALLKRGSRDLAVEQLGRGIQVAHARGDMMPRNDMIRMLEELGAPVPQLGEVQQQEVGEGQVLCVRCRQVNPKLPRPPFRNELGQSIHQQVCQPCWREWIGMGTKVINELRLPLSDPAAQKVYDQHMKEFLNLPA
jgi:Fe-S cluster biosynthesis and repair protein YggX